MGSLLLGGVLGFVAGAVVGGVFMWALGEVERTDSLDPLQELKIDNDPLTTEQTRQYIDRLTAGYLNDAHNAGLVVGILKNGRSQVFGYGTVEKGRQQTPDGATVFELASVGKTFTATVLADMVLRGEVQVDTPVQSLLPAHVTLPQVNGRAITLQDLATQSSGLPSLPDNFEAKDPLNPYADYTVEKMYEALSAMPSGEFRYAYSNLGFGLLGHVLALRANQDYESLVVERLCTPLGMDSTRMTLSPSLKARLATPHHGGKPVKVWEDTTMAGAGSFLSTADDLLKYVAAHLSDREDSPCDALRLTRRKRRPTDRPSTAIGLGWHITSENALDIVWHNGGSGGSRSYVAFEPARNVGVAVLSNSSASVDSLGRKVLYLLLRWHSE